MSRRGSVAISPAGPATQVPGSRRDSDRPLRRLAVLATSLTFLLVGVGALVRASGSGDACPDWPRCHGSLIPRFELHVLIEYSHRLTAFLTIVAVAALALDAWRRYRDVPRVVRPSVAALGLVIVQAMLGAVVVWTKLEVLNVTAHLATAMLLVAALVLATVAAFSVEARPGGSPDRLTRATRWTAGAVYALLLVGAIVRGEGAGLVFGDWPLMGGRVVPDLSATGAVVQFAHRALAAVVAVLVVWLAVRFRRARGGRPVAAALAVVGAGLFLGQVVIGAANVWTGLAVAPVVGHVVVASLIWGAVVATASASRVEAAGSFDGARGVRARPESRPETGNP